MYCMMLGARPVRNMSSLSPYHVTLITCTIQYTTLAPRTSTASQYAVNRFNVQLTGHRGSVRILVSCLNNKHLIYCLFGNVCSESGEQLWNVDLGSDQSLGNNVKLNTVRPVSYKRPWGGFSARSLYPAGIDEECIVLCWYRRGVHSGPAVTSSLCNRCSNYWREI